MYFYVNINVDDFGGIRNARRATDQYSSPNEYCSSIIPTAYRLNNYNKRTAWGTYEHSSVIITRSRSKEISDFDNEANEWIKKKKKMPIKKNVDRWYCVIGVKSATHTVGTIYLGDSSIRSLIEIAFLLKRNPATTPELTKLRYI